MVIYLYTIFKGVILLPEICRFEGIIIKLLFLDNDRHHKPHVHIYYGDYEASVAMDGELLSGSLPIKKFRLVQAWLILHEDELYEMWNMAIKGLPFGKIKPLN